LKILRSRVLPIAVAVLVVGFVGGFALSTYDQERSALCEIEPCNPPIDYTKASEVGIQFGAALFFAVLLVSGLWQAVRR